MKLFSSDCEVFESDWIFVFKQYPGGEHIIFHNDTKGLREFIGDDLYGLFNGKHYGRFILRAILAGADNRMVKEINDSIIEDRQRGWEHWYIKENRMKLNTIDIRDDMYLGLSLKAIEGHMGLPIEESSVAYAQAENATSRGVT